MRKTHRILHEKNAQNTTWEKRTEYYMKYGIFLRKLGKSIMCQTGRVWASRPAEGSGRSVKKKTDSNTNVIKMCVHICVYKMWHGRVFYLHIGVKLFCEYERVSMEFESLGSTAWHQAGQDKQEECSRDRAAEVLVQPWVEAHHHRTLGTKNWKFEKIYSTLLGLLMKFLPLTPITVKYIFKTETGKSSWVPGLQAEKLIVK